MAEKTLIRKHLIRPYLNKNTTGEADWIQIKKATEYTRSMNPTTEERDYISDESPTTEVTQYKPSEALSVTSYKGEEDFELFYALYKERAIGAAAQRDFLLVHVFDETEVEGTSYFYAEKCSATITVNELNATASTISVDVAENGTPVKGYVSYTEGKPVFVEELPA